MSKIKLFLFVGAFVFLSLTYGPQARHFIGEINQTVLGWYVKTKTLIQQSIEEHFAQEEEIQRLRLENQKLEKSALLSIAFATKLNHVLKEHNLSGYDPRVTLISTIGYAHLNDFGKVWLDFEGYDPARIYGLVAQGYAAGIVVPSDGHPMGLMLSDPKAIFSVYVGGEKMQGIAQGNRKELVVKYISQWLQPKIGDEVVTSGLDGVFFEGIKVGVVSDVVEEVSSKSVIVTPYLEHRVPPFMHVVLRP